MSNEIAIGGTGMLLRDEEDLGCFGKVDGWFISRQEMPKLCGDNRCFNMDACFRASWEKQTGLKAEDMDEKNGKTWTYKVTTPRWRGVSK